MLKYTYEAPLIQGDVILKRLTELPAAAELMTSQVKVLQMSEVTGHHHHFQADSNVRLYQMPSIQVADPGEEIVRTITENLGKFIIVEDGGATLYHGREFDDKPAAKGTGDHNALSVPPGIYYIDIVREFDYDKNEPTRVVD